MAKGKPFKGVKWKSPSGTVTDWHLRGIEEVTTRINEEYQKISIDGGKALILAARMVLNDADITPPLVPILTGNLRASQFIGRRQYMAQISENSNVGASVDKTAEGFIYVEFGYGANYAAAVHEMMQAPSGKPINWTRPGSGPKFFEASLKRNEPKIKFILENRMKLR
jgi:hypothetical protein